MVKTLYRYERCSHTAWNAVLNLSAYAVLKETEKGYWIWDRCEKRWVSKYGKSRFAYPTVEEAYVNFTKRTQLYIAILQNRIQTAKLYLDADQPLKPKTLV